ncbi:hypothetical protein MRB53_038258 [Persea americana]|nr:hypothetical protein MRB53_038258 [Persea americana]
MEPSQHVAPRRMPSTSERSASSTSRHSSTVRVRPSKRGSNGSLHMANPRTTADDQTLTSFPSLSPSLESSPEAFNELHARLHQASRRDASPRPVPRSFDGLFTPPTAPEDRIALFDDTPQYARDIPGALHLQDDEHVRKLISKVGPIKLVRQMAQDLAQRDAYVTQLQRRAEERERLLKKMLVECQVSNMDIEMRLRELEPASLAANGGLLSNGTHKTQESSMDTEAPLKSRMTEALNEELGSDAASVASGDAAHDGNTSHGRPGGEHQAGGGWKEVFRSSTIAARRTTPASATDKLGPPAHRREEDSPTVRTPSVAKSVKSTNSFASWAMRLIGGGPKVEPGPSKTSRDRAATLTSPTAHKGSSGRAAPLVRAKSNTAVATLNAALKERRSLGPHGTIKSTHLEPNRNKLATPNAPLSPTTAEGEAVTNLGPVELDTILPEGTRPPALSELKNMHPDLLTDRFGFIYDQRRRKRQNEALAATKKKPRASDLETVENRRGIQHGVIPDESDALSVRSAQSQNGLERVTSRSQSPTSLEEQEHEHEPKQKKWQDYLKLSNYTSELLSHTPSSAPITDLTIADEDELDVQTTKAPQIVMTKRGSEPCMGTAPQPSPSRVVSGNAEMSQLTIAEPDPLHTPSLAQPDPVKALLTQLTDVHDTLQREKTPRWNEFLRKGLATRAALAVQKEANSRAWCLAAFRSHTEPVSGLSVVAPMVLRIPGYYEDLVSSKDNDAIIVQQIRLDIKRTLTDNVFFRRGQGVQKLEEILLAYSRRNPEIGYCQGMNLITANLLLIMPSAEDVFWMLTALIENILPEKYYDASLLASRADGMVLRQYVGEILPRLSLHLDNLGIELEALTFQWFLSVFTDCLSAEALFRVWDVVFCVAQGATFLFQVALALLSLNETALLACDNPAAVYEYINQHMTDHAISIDNLIRCSEALKKEVKREDVQERRRKIIEDELEVARQRAHDPER